MSMENVWDYPRPPRLEPCTRRVRVIHADRTLAESTNALRILETSHPPTIYVPPDDVDRARLTPSGGGSTVCEWKGRAVYWDLIDGAKRVAWSYPDPVEHYAALKDHLAFYPSRVDACLLDDEVVQAQPSDFYGGWLTSDITGDVKGPPGTLHW